MTITVSSGVTSSGLTISAGDPVVVLSGGELLASTILSGGSATLSRGAVGNELGVSSGGVLQGDGELAGGDGASGTIIGLTLVSSGTLFLTGATATGMTATQSSIIADDGGSTALGTVVSDGAQLSVIGSASGSVIGSGGTEIVFPGGIGSGDTIQRGGFLVADDGRLID
jgi:autotransporter passenger strand-loop-strand repeat protein